MTLVIKGPYRTRADPAIPRPSVIASDITSSLLLFLDNRYGGGESSLSAFVHNQASAATQWTINHNLGYRPQIQTYTDGGIEILGDVLHMTENQAIVSFATEQSGFARCI